MLDKIQNKYITSNFLNFESQYFFVAHSSLGDFEVRRQPDVFFCASLSASLGRVRYWQLALRTAGYSGQQLTRHDPWKRLAEVCSLDVLGIGKDMKRLVYSL